MPPRPVLLYLIKSIDGHAALHALSLWHAWEGKIAESEIYCINFSKNPKNFPKFLNSSVSPGASSSDGSVLLFGRARQKASRVITLQICTERKLLESIGPSHPGRPPATISYSPWSKTRMRRQSKAPFFNSLWSKTRKRRHLDFSCFDSAGLLPCKGQRVIRMHRWRTPRVRRTYDS